MDIKLQTKICDNFSLSGFFVFFQKNFNCEFMSRKKLEYMFMAYLFVWKYQMVALWVIKIIGKNFYSVNVKFPIEEYKSFWRRDSVGWKSIRENVCITD